MSTPVISASLPPFPWSPFGRRSFPSPAVARAIWSEMHGDERPKVSPRCKCALVFGGNFAPSPKTTPVGQPMPMVTDAAGCRRSIRAIYSRPLGSRDPHADGVKTRTADTTACPSPTPYRYRIRTISVVIVGHAVGIALAAGDEFAMAAIRVHADDKTAGGFRPAPKPLPSSARAHEIVR